MAKVDETTLLFKHEFFIERVSQGKAFLQKADTEDTARLKLLGWMAAPDARKLAKNNGWVYEKIERRRPPNPPSLRRAEARPLLPVLRAVGDEAPARRLVVVSRVVARAGEAGAAGSRGSVPALTTFAASGVVNPRASRAFAPAVVSSLALLR